MNYAVEMWSNALIHISSFTEIGLTIKESIRGPGTHTSTNTSMCTHKEGDDLISLLLLFQNKESRLKRTHTYVVI
jgi:hypothetical protein